MMNDSTFQRNYEWNPDLIWWLLEKGSIKHHEESHCNLMRNYYLEHFHPYHFKIN